MPEGSSNGRPNPGPQPRATRILARSLLKDLRDQGYGDEQVLALTTELLALVAADIRARRAAAAK